MQPGHVRCLIRHPWHINSRSIQPELLLAAEQYRKAPVLSSMAVEADLAVPRPVFECRKVTI